MTKQQIKTYQKAIKDARAELPSYQRKAATFLGIAFVSKTIELMELVLFRPHSMILGYVTALVGGALALITVASFNYRIDSLQILFLLFAFGYGVGIVVDYLKVLSK